MPQVVVALGSNVGDSLQNLHAAVEALRERFEVVRLSSLYRTAPMYVVDQPDFLNGAVLVETHMGPLQVLRLLKQIEAEIGRRKGTRFGPREIDLDLIAYGALAYRFADEGSVVLEVPHPRIAERRFVLAPMMDLVPEYEVPGMGKVTDLLRQTNDHAESVKRIEDALF